MYPIYFLLLGQIFFSSNIFQILFITKLLLFQQETFKVENIVKISLSHLRDKKVENNSERECNIKKHKQ